MNNRKLLKFVYYLTTENRNKILIQQNDVSYEYIIKSLSTKNKISEKKIQKIKLQIAWLTNVGYLIRISSYSLLNMFNVTPEGLLYLENYKKKTFDFWVNYIITPLIAIIGLVIAIIALYQKKT